MNSVAFFKWLISVAGTKLPLIWPEVLAIVAAVQAIIAKLSTTESLAAAGEPEQVAESDIAAAEATFAQLDSSLGA